jgi:hypothetical protein
LPIPRDPARVPGEANGRRLTVVEPRPEPALFLIDLRALPPRLLAERRRDERHARSEFATLQDRICAAVGASTSAPVALDPRELDARGVLGPLREQARRLLAAHARAEVFADPRLAFTLPFWHSVADPGSACLIVGCSPGELAGRLAGVPSAPPALALWQCYLAAALLHSARLPRWRSFARRGCEPLLEATTFDWLAKVLPGRTQLVASLHADMPEPWYPAATAEPELTAGARSLLDAVHGNPPNADLLAAWMQQGALELAAHASVQAGRLRESIGASWQQERWLRRELDALRAEQSDLQRQITVTRDRVGTLRTTLLQELDRWLTLEDLDEKRDVVRDLARQLELSRRAWSQRLARLAAVPFQLGARALARLRRRRRLQHG